MLGKSKVTAKYQVTIPRDVREKVGVRPGEVVTVEATPQGEIVVKLYSKTRDPMGVLIGKKSLGTVPIEELERMEAR